MLHLVVQSPGMLHESDLKDDLRDQDLGQESGGEITLEKDHRVVTEIEDTVHQLNVAQVQGNGEETDHVKEDVVGQETGQDEVDQGIGNLDITVDHPDANNIFLTEYLKIQYLFT